MDVQIIGGQVTAQEAMDMSNGAHSTLKQRTALGALMAAALVLGGCASPMIQSDPARGNVAVSGIVYALPKAQVLLKASRRLVQEDDVDTAKKDAADKTAAAKSAEDNQAAADGELKAREAELKTAAAKGVGEAASKDIELRRDLAKVRLALAEVRLEKAQLAAAEAQKALALLHGQVGRWVESASLEVLPSVPDPAHRFVARHDASVWRDDALNMSVDKGLLSTGESKATGQVANVLVSLARAVAARNIGTTAPGARIQFSSRLKPRTDPNDTCMAYDFAWVFDPTNPTEVEEAKAEVAKAGLVRLKLPGEQTPVVAGTPKAGVGVSGLAYRAPRTMLIEAALDTTGGESGKACRDPKAPAAATARLTASLPDSSATYVLAVEGAMMTKSAVKHVFKEGMLAELSIDRPSALVSIANLPVDIAKALISIPAEIVKLRVDYSTQQTSEAAQAVKLIEAQIDLLQAQRDLAAAQAGSKP